MARYVVKKELQIICQEADKGDIVFNVPDVISLVDADIEFGVYTQHGQQLMKKETADVIVADQQITVPLTGEDTSGYSGTHVWELTVIQPGDGRITIGKGDLKVIKKWN